MSAAEIVAFASRLGLTVADFKLMSIGFLIDVCKEKTDMLNGEHEDREEKYLQIKAHLPIIERKYAEGTITEARYQEYMARYKELAAEYEQ